MPFRNRNDVQVIFSLNIVSRLYIYYSRKLMYYCVLPFFTIAIIATDRSTRFIKEMNNPKKAIMANMYRFPQQSIFPSGSVLRSESITCNKIFLLTKTSFTSLLALPYNIVYRSRQTEMLPVYNLQMYKCTIVHKCDKSA